MSDGYCASLVVAKACNDYNDARDIWMRETCELKGMKVSFEYWNSLINEDDRYRHRENPFRFEQKEKNIEHFKSKMDHALELKEFVQKVCCPHLEDLY